MQRKPGQTRAPNAAEKRFLAWVKTHPCIQCGAYPVVADHMYGSTFKHRKVLIGMWAILPLCECCDSVKTNGSARAYQAEFGETQAQSWTRLIEKCPEAFYPPLDVQLSIEDWNR